MSKSQLRRLAKDYAAGRLDHDAYVRTRGELIDAIVAGEVAIESSHESTADFGVTTKLERRIRSTPLPLIIGACVVAAIILAFFVTRPSMPPGGEEHVGGQLPGKPVSPARLLVEDFLTTRDWSGESLTEFRDRWNALTPNEQAEARSAPWFRRLAEALREEINAHKALAELDGSGLSTTTGRRLADFGEFLGIEAEMPTPPVAERLKPRPSPADQPLSGSQWLAAQADENYTLQLFAVNHLDRLEQITARHPDVSLHLLSFENQTPRFRLVHGSFASEEQALQAEAALPQDLRSQAPAPLVRRISELREEERAAPPTATAAPADSEPAPDYTLQIFASPSRENVDRLVARYQTLDLRVHVSDGDANRYRVLYGHFDSPQAAQEASEKLPAAMLEEVGKPLLRESSEFH